MLAGLMMDTELTTTSIMEFADKVYADSEIVSITADQLHDVFIPDAIAARVGVLIETGT